MGVIVACLGKPTLQALATSAWQIEVSPRHIPHGGVPDQPCPPARPSLTDKPEARVLFIGDTGQSTRVEAPKWSGTTVPRILNSCCSAFAL